MKKTLSLIFTLFALVMCLSLCACGSENGESKSKFVGTYVAKTNHIEQYGQLISDAPEAEVRITFNADGTGIYQRVITAEGSDGICKVGDIVEDETLTWVADEKNISFTVGGEWTAVYELKLNQLIDIKGNRFTYTKVS